MVVQRLLDIYALMEQAERENGPDGYLCKVAQEFTSLAGAAIALHSSDNSFVRMCASNTVAENLLDLEVTLGEGPSIDTSEQGVAVEYADLRASGSRWPVYSSRAMDLGARAAFGFPLHVGTARFGVLTFYGDETGPLSSQRCSDAYLMASVAARAVLSLQAEVPRGALAWELESQLSYDFALHQAAGMLSVQGSVPVKDALVMLRAHSFRTSLSLSALAERVIARRTWFDPVLEDWVEESERVEA